jgi:hypothetical protein
MLLVLLQLKIAQTKEKSNDSVAQGHSLATGQVPEGAASEARLWSTILRDNKLGDFVKRNTIWIL